MSNIGVIDRIAGALSSEHTNGNMPPIFVPPAPKALDRDSFLGPRRTPILDHKKAEADKKAEQDKLAAAKKLADAEAAVAKGKQLNKELDEQIEALQAKYNDLLKACLMGYGALHAVNKEGDLNSLLAKIEAELVA